jgi:hypothetical protein
VGLGDVLGLAIPVIENLASHQGSYDTLNLTDNSITVLGNIPLCECILQEDQGGKLARRGRWTEGEKSVASYSDGRCGKTDGSAIEKRQ